MAVPDYQKMMLPALQALSEGDERPCRDIYETIATAVGLDDVDRKEKLPNKDHPKYKHRAQWALTDLRNAGLVERVRLGVYRISPEGRALLEKQPAHIDRAVLRTLETYRAHTRSRKKNTKSGAGADPQNGGSNRAVPTAGEPEQVRSTVAEVLAKEILKQVRNSSPSCLDGVVADLMAAIGYSRSDADSTPNDRGLAHSHDGGSLWIDPLGVVKVYLKTDHRPRSSPVSDVTLREFAATMVGTDQGVFVTTSTFSPKAVDYLNRSPLRIALIDGERLAELLAKHGRWSA